MNKARLFLIELLETRRVIGLMLLGMGLSITQRQSSLVNALVIPETGYIIGLFTMACGFGMAGRPYARYSALFSVPLLIYSLLNVWYAVALNTWLPLGAFLSWGVFVIAWTDMLKPVRIIKVKDIQAMATPQTTGETVIYNLLHSKRFRSFLIGAVTIIIVNLVPQLGPKADLISLLVAGLVGLLIAGYTVTDASQDSSGAGAMTLADALQGLISEILQAIFAGSTSGAALTDTVARMNKTIVLKRPSGEVIYVTTSTTPPPGFIPPTPDDNGVTLPGQRETSTYDVQPSG